LNTSKEKTFEMAAIAAMKVCLYRNLAQYEDLKRFIETLECSNRTLQECKEKIESMIKNTKDYIFRPATYISIFHYKTISRHALESELDPPFTSAEDPSPPSFLDCNLQDSEWHPSITPLMRETSVAVNQQICAAMERPISSYPLQVQQRLQPMTELRRKVMSVIAILGVYADDDLKEIKSLLSHEIEMERIRDMAFSQYHAIHQGSRGFSHGFSRPQSHQGSRGFSHGFSRPQSHQGSHHGSRGFSRPQSHQGSHQGSHHGSRGFSRPPRHSPADANLNWRAPPHTFTTR
jgi:hypothetical protein